MNDKGNIKASSKPTKALAKTSPLKGSVHPVRRETASHKKPLRKVRGNPARIHEKENRCESSLPVCSVLSDEVLITKPRLKPRKGWLWLVSTIARRLQLKASRSELCDWVRGAHAILNSNEAVEKSGRGRPSVSPTTWTTTGSGQAACVSLRVTGDGSNAPSTGVPPLPAFGGSHRQVARAIQKKNKKNKSSK